MTTFTAHCQQGHDRVDFTGDRAGFEDHMLEEHGRRKRFAGMADESTDGRSAPGWAKGRIAGPYPHRAPTAPADTAQLTAVLVGAGQGPSREYLAEWSTPESSRVPA